MVNSITPKLEPKCPFFTDIISIINSRSSFAKRGNSSIERFFKSSGLLICSKYFFNTI